MKDKYSKVIFDALAQMEIEDSFSKMNFILANRDDYDYFADRSFSVLFCKVKKLFPDKRFRTIKGNIVRTE
jgi:hypothetical protein